MNNYGWSVVDAGQHGVADRQQNYVRQELGSNWGDLEWLEAGYGGVNTKANIRLTNHNALQYSPVSQAVTMISGDVARLPLHLYRRTNQDTLERAYDVPAYRAFAFSPHPCLSWFKFWRRLMTQVLVWGAGYAWLTRDERGNVVGAVPLLSDRTAPIDWESDDKPGQVYQTEIDGRCWYPHESQLLVLEWITLDNCNPIDPVVQARETWAAGLASIHFVAKFFGRGGRLGGLLELPAGTGPKARDTVEEGFRRSYEGPDAAFQTVILREGAKFHAAQATLEQAQGVEGRREGVRDVARFYNLKPSRLGEESGSSYGSKAEDNRDYLDTTLAPYLTSICAELNNKTLRPEQSWPATPSSPRLYWEHNTAALLQLNLLERYQAYQIGVSNTWLSPNDVRRAENLNPRDGGNAYANPNTSSPASAAGAMKAVAALERLAVSTVRNVARVQLEKCERKRHDNQAFMRAVLEDASDRVAKLKENCHDVLAAWAGATGRELTPVVEEVATAYRTTVEAKLNWLLDHVPADSLRVELPAASTAALEELTGRLTAIFRGADEDDESRIKPPADGATAEAG